MTTDCPSKYSSPEGLESARSKSAEAMGATSQMDCNPPRSASASGLPSIHDTTPRSLLSQQERTAGASQVLPHVVVDSQYTTTSGNSDQSRTNQPTHGTDTASISPLATNTMATSQTLVAKESGIPVPRSEDASVPNAESNTRATGSHLNGQADELTITHVQKVNHPGKPLSETERGKRKAGAEMLPPASKRQKEALSSQMSRIPAFTPNAPAAIPSLALDPPRRSVGPTFQTSCYTYNGQPLPQQVQSPLQGTTIQKEKAWTSRTWHAKQYADLAQMALDHFPFDAFKEKHGKSQKEVEEVFNAVVKIQVLKEAHRAAGMSRGGLGEDLVKEKRGQEDQVMDIQREARKQVAQNLPAIQADVEKKLTVERLREAKQEMYQDANRQGFIPLDQLKALLVDANMLACPLNAEQGLTEAKLASPGPSSARGRRSTTKNMDEAQKDLLEASEVVWKIKRAEERKEKANAAKKDKKIDGTKGKKGGK